MNTFEFTIIASGLDHEADDFEDRFFAAGCEDATIAVSRGAIVLDFSRKAPDLENAIGSAIADVEAAGARVERIEPDYLVSLAEIAERAGLTRAAITHYAKGERGEDFPIPVARVSSQSPLWDWADVSEWLLARSQIAKEEVLFARVIRANNRRLRARRARAA
jgi:hypothetical protein